VTKANWEGLGLTDPGRVRGNNEDAFAVDLDAGLFVLADGMGGYNAGEVASQMLVTFLRDELGAWLKQAAGAPAEAVSQAMHICVENANRAIFDTAENNPRMAGMGTTLVLAVVRPEGLWLGHIGDSRAYRWRGGRTLTQITRDHSLLQEQIDAGLLTPEQAASALHKNLVTRAVGVEPHTELELHFHAWQPDDLLMLCSDGMSDMVRDPDIASVFERHNELPDLARALVEKANAQGGRDNITVVVGRPVRPAGSQPTASKPWWGIGRR
jgi:serine/threonine protein phosphatase PrpC